MTEPYQDAMGKLVFRYDNSPHYPELTTAPNHKHVGEKDVLAAETPDLFQILKEIEAVIQASTK